MRRLGLVALLAAIGCGGGATDPLVGAWALQLDNGCVVGFTFDATHAYERDGICPLTGGGVGLQSEQGSYIRDATRLGFTIEKSTCTGEPSPYHVEYSLQPGPRLYLTFSDGVEVLSAFEPTGAGAATFGCFMADGFHPGPLVPH